MLTEQPVCNVGLISWWKNINSIWLYRHSVDSLLDFNAYEGNVYNERRQCNSIAG